MEAKIVTAVLRNKWKIRWFPVVMQMCAVRGLIDVV